MADPDDDADDDSAETPDQELLEEAKRRFKRAREAWQKQRARERDDLRFQVPENQWEDEAKRARSGDTSRGIPARPMLSVDKLAQPIQLIKNQMRNAHLGIQVHPISPDADDDTAEVQQGLYRDIERRSNAGAVRGWAFDRAVPCGFGWYLVDTCYDEASDNPTDQTIVLRRILYQDAVYIDPSAQEIDFSDAEFGQIAVYVPISRFKAMWPKAEVPKRDTWDVEADTDGPTPEWAKFDEDGRPVTVLVVTEWRKVHQDKTVTVKTPDGPQERHDDRVKVRCAKFAGHELLEDNAWNGHHIPLVPVMGREIQPYDGERRWQGVITTNKDPQRAYNYALTAAVEGTALEPKAPYVLYADSIDGYEDWWKQANTRNLPYLPVKYVQKGGAPLPLPERVQVDGSRMQLSIGLAQAMEGALQTGTMQFDPSLGRSSGSERSGKAIMALQQQGDASTSDYLASFADISMQREAVIVLDLMAAVYDRPGRVARILDEEDNSKAVMLGMPFRVDPRTKQPVPVEVGENEPLPEDVKHYDLSKGRYQVAVSVGRSKQSKMDAGADALGQLLSSEPQLLPILGDLWLEFQDFPHAQEAKDRLAKWRDAQFPFLRESDQPSAMDAQQMQQQMQAMQQQIQQMGQALQSEQMKVQAQLQAAQIKADSAIQTTQIKAESDMRIAELKAQMQAITDALNRGHETKLARTEAAHDIAMASADVGHTAAKAAAEAHAQATLAPLKMDPMRDSVGEPLSPDEGTV